MTKLQDIICPTCGKKDTWRSENAYKPFCSSRCKLVDLGEWASESRKIPGAPVSPTFSGDDNSTDDSEDQFI